MARRAQTQDEANRYAYGVRSESEQYAVKLMADSESSRLAIQRVIEGNAVNSVTTYGYPSDPSTNFGPYFGEDVANLYARAKQIG